MPDVDYEAAYWDVLSAVQGGKRSWGQDELVRLITAAAVANRIAPSERLYDAREVPGEQDQAGQAGHYAAQRRMHAVPGTH